MRIIGLMGPAGAGKSTIATYLCEKYGAQRYALANPLKEIARRTLDFSHEQVYGTQEEKEATDPRYGFSARFFLQRLGTEGIRSVFGADVWVDLLLEKIMREKPFVAVVEDVRFLNEVTAIRAAGGDIWRLESPGRESAADATHASEAEWMKAPYDRRIAPSRRDLGLLFEIVDEACRSSVA